MLGFENFFNTPAKGAQERDPPASGPTPASSDGAAGDFPDVLERPDQSGLSGKPESTQKEPAMTLNAGPSNTAERELDQMLAQQAEMAARVDAKRQGLKTAVLAEMREKIARYGLTAGELGFPPTAAPAPVPAGDRTVSVPKYRDPQSGKTWSGRGRTPVWLHGKDRLAYLINPAAV
ncbi:MAG: H-NS histone family protein [Burkholderiaceae bacterium]|jgi:DNA-binding protein H-NS|nr:H-NS histone family protein [Burkholderiaceae bacterium]